MPLYEYECTACGQRFERIQKFSDPPEAACPQCGGPAERLLSAPAVHFKGSGFYATDYARKSPPADQPEVPQSGTPRAQETESRTETKAEDKSKAEKPATDSKPSSKKKPSSTD
ncbi:MAG: FmdB family zinc ribbon protein [Terriglobia bacterium]